jgi:signal peptidase I
MKNKASDGVVETIKTLVYAIAIAIVIRTFLYEPFNIPSGSMVPTLLVGDYLFVSKFSYGYSRYSLPFGLPLISGRIFFHEPDRGDVIVFKYPRDPSTDYIKRLIGLPGDRIQVLGSVVYINGKPVKLQRVDSFIDPETGLTRQQYVETLPNGVSHRILLALGEQPPPAQPCEDPHQESRDLENTCPFIVPPGHYFMMGDNRDNSADSRDPSSGVGYVPAENLVGHAEFIFFSTSGYAHWWEIWNWPFTIRYDRLFTAIH